MRCYCFLRAQTSLWQLPPWSVSPAQKSCVTEDMWEWDTSIKTKKVCHIGATRQADVTQFLAILCHMSHVTQLLLYVTQVLCTFHTPHILDYLIIILYKKDISHVMYSICVHTSCYNKCVHEVYNLSLTLSYINTYVTLILYLIWHHSACYKWHQPGQMMMILVANKLVTYVTIYNWYDSMGHCLQNIINHKNIKWKTDT